MKKLIATAAILSLAVAGWTQGQIDFRNRGPVFATEADRLVYEDQVGGQGLWSEPGEAYVAALFFVPGADGAEGEMTQAGASGAFRADDRAVGTWSGGLRTLEGAAPGTVATVQVRVWDSAAFDTFAEAVAGGGLWGASEAWNYNVPNVGAPPNAAYMEGLRAFALVPEPSVIALGVLGAASLLLFRRRK